MLSLNTRIELADKLGKYMLSDNESWGLARERAIMVNSWFIAEHIDIAIQNIAEQYLEKDKLENWLSNYHLPAASKTVGIVMAGNIPMVGFHDFLCGFISGHKLVLKPSSKDTVLITHLLEQLYDWEPAVREQVKIADILKGCDAYIATGSNNTARYFEQYFGKYPNIIRKNRTSVAVLDGNETEQDFEGLAKDVFTYFGLGCRNVSQLCVPENYDFDPLLAFLERYDSVINHHKYKNNYDYYLAIYLLNKTPYRTNGTLLLTENEVPFSPVSVLHYRRYNNVNTIVDELNASDSVQCIVGNGHIPFGDAQKPSLGNYADNIDTMQFLSGL
ncbi:MAG: acyl-CoA reductase [Bacteroidetes bacterium 46-16]|nr:MAG: acyl-CoA reductase [Bacteroidetes bacterium 46-16]